MKLVYSDVEYAFELEENKVNIIILEDPKIFRQWIAGLQLQLAGGEGKLILSDQGKELSIAQYMDLITDIFMLEINSRKVLNKLYAELSDISVDGHMSEKTHMLEKDILAYLHELTTLSSYPIEYSLDAPIAGLFKWMDLRLDDEEGDAFIKLDTYVRTMGEMFSLKCFVMINLKAFFRAEEITQLYQSAFYQKANLILLENRPPDYHLPEEVWYILDKDHCEIYPAKPCE